MIPAPIQERFIELSRHRMVNGRDYLDFVSLCGQHMLKDELREKAALELLTKLPRVDYYQHQNPFGAYKPAYGKTRTYDRMRDRRLFTVALVGTSLAFAGAITDALSGFHGMSVAQPPRSNGIIDVENALLATEHVFPDAILLNNWSFTDFPTVRKAASILSPDTIYVGYEPEPGEGRSRYFDPEVVVLRLRDDSVAAGIDALGTNDNTLIVRRGYEPWSDMRDLALGIHCIVERDDENRGMNLRVVRKRAVEETVGELGTDLFEAWHTAHIFVPDVNREPDYEDVIGQLKLWKSIRKHDPERDLA